MVASQISHVACGEIKEVVLAKLSRTADHLAKVIGYKNRLYIYDFAHHRTEPVFEIDGAGVIGLRTFLRTSKRNRRDLVLSTEVLYFTGNKGEVARIDTGDFPYQMRNPLVMSRGGDEITCIKESSDGRYVAVSDTEGYVSIWNFDQGDGSKAVEIFCKKLSEANVLDMSFDRTNTRLYIATSKGEQIMLSLTTGDVLPLHDGRGWPAFTVACHPDQGMAFAGEGNRIWLLDVKHYPKQVLSLNEVPFILFQAYTMGGLPCLIPIGCRKGSGIGYIDTELGDCIHEVSFANEDEIVATGHDRIEIYNVKTGKMVHNTGKQNGRPVTIVCDKGHLAIGWVKS